MCGGFLEGEAIPFSSINQRDSHTEQHQGTKPLRSPPAPPAPAGEPRHRLPPSLILSFPPGALGSLHPSHGMCERWDLSAFVLGS